MNTKKLALLGVTGLMTACQPSSQYNVSGQLEGISTDTILVMSRTFDRSSEPVRDTVALENGKFEMNIESNELKMVYITEKPSLKPNPDGSIPAVSMKSANFMLLPGHAVTINGSLDKYTVKGSEFYAEIEKLKQVLAPVEQKLEAAWAKRREMRNGGVSSDSLQMAYKAINDYESEKQEFILDYVKQNPDKEASLYFLMWVNPEAERYAEVFDLLSKSVKSGIMAPLYKNMHDDLEKVKKIAEAEKKVAEGNDAPDFTLKNLEGKEVALSSLRGKYVVLDFWGSWCGWCIKGIPDMKKAYAKYKGKMEILGIDCNDTEEKWKEAVKKHELPWFNVRNAGDPDVTALYAVRGYPTKLVISPVGKILKKIVGEDPAFYEYLDKTIK